MKKSSILFIVLFAFCSQPSSVDDAVDVTTTTVLNEQIIDDDEPGVLSFTEDDFFVPLAAS